MRRLCAIAVMALPWVLLWADNGFAQAEVPQYKPSSRSSTPQDISLNTYGASRLAPDAISIGETAPDFSLPRVGGGSYQLDQAVGKGPVVIIFYRGPW